MAISNQNMATNAPFLFTDTDSFCCHIQTEELYPDMSQYLNLFDASQNVY